MRTITLLSLIVTAVACSDDGSGPADTPASIELDRTTLNLFTTEMLRLQVTVRDRSGRALPVAVQWSSTDAGVARVDSAGSITAVSTGSATIEARAGGHTAQAGVIVRPTLGFILPLSGTINQDFYYTNYVDLQAGAGIRDFQCGLKTYDGHNGTDIVLPSFARMDQGVEVVAAAAGTVAFVQDGLPDRNKTWENGGGFANHVQIQHRDGFRSYYGHMMRNSIRVAVGQPVQPGTVLGKVGSSGTSDMPHLHIEFRQNGTPAEVHAGSCGAAFTHWAAPPVYQDQFGLIQSGLTRADLNLDAVKDPPAQVDTFSMNESRLWFWVHLHNVRAGGVSRFEFVSPDGQTLNGGTLTHANFYSMSWWWVWTSVAGRLTQPGVWRVQYSHDGVMFAERSFLLKPGTTTYHMLPEPGAPSHGIGGGGLTRVHD